MVSDKELEDMRKTKREMKSLYFAHGMPWRQGIDKWEYQGYPSWWDEID